MLLGDLSVSLSVDTEADPADTEMTRNQADKARYYTDKCVKNILVACWRLRESALGTMTVLAGCLVVSPSTRSGVDLLSSQELFKDVDESQVWVGTRGLSGLSGSPSRRRMNGSLGLSERVPLPFTL